MDKFNFLNLFDPPDGYVGLEMWLSSLSADKESIEQIVEHFATGRRAYNREIGHLFLDARTPIISGGKNFTTQCAGVRVYPPKQPISLRLQHSKVFLLGFSWPKEKAPSFFRIIISTGNLTQESFDNQLELVWQTEYNASKKIDLNKSENQSLCDLCAVIHFFKRLVETYYTSHKGIFDTLPALKSPDGYNPRFISSLSSSLGNKIQSIIKSKRGLTNIICGSGFYEQPTIPDSVPKTIQFIQDRISNFKCGTLLVNPLQAGALINWKKHKDWEILEAIDTDKADRLLHAKFILFSTESYKKPHARDGHKIIDRGLLYIGSGNLTMQGFVLPEKNIETGILFEIYDDENFEKKLFLGGRPARNLNVGSVGEDEIPTEVIESPPIYAFVQADDNEALIEYYDDVHNPFSVTIDSVDFELNPLDKEQKIKIDGTKTLVEIEYKKNSFNIPVKNKDGQYYYEIGKAETFDEAVEKLFTNNYDIVSDPDDELYADDAGVSSVSKIKVDHNYPMHTLAVFLEKIARQNEWIEQEDSEYLVTDWLYRLSRSFSVLPPDTLQEWKSLKIDIFNFLKEKSFALGSKYNGSYLKTLEQLKQEWKVI